MEDLATIKICYKEKCFDIASIKLSVIKDFINIACSDFINETIAKSGGSRTENTSSINMNIVKEDTHSVKASEDAATINFDEFKKLLDATIKGGSCSDINGDISMDRFLSVLNKNILTKSATQESQQIKTQSHQINAQPQDNQNKGAAKKKHRRRVYGNDFASDEFDDYLYTESKLLELAE